MTEQKHTHRFIYIVMLSLSDTNIITDHQLFLDFYYIQYISLLLVGSLDPQGSFRGLKEVPNFFLKLYHFNLSIIVPKINGFGRNLHIHLKK